MRTSQVFFWLFFVVSLSAAASVADAADGPNAPAHPGQIAGVVVRADTGQPIAGAYVGTGFPDDARGPHGRMKTDEKGQFLLKNLRLGEHQLVVTHPGFAHHDQKVTAREKLPEVRLWITLRPADGVIAGRVIDAEEAPVPDAYVVLCDQATGVPIAGEALRPITDELLAGGTQLIDFLQRWTDPQGRFRFERVPAGRYRLIAQSCPGARPKDTFDKVMDREIRLRGIAEDVVVSKDSSPEVVIRPLGTGVLRIDDNLKVKNGVLVAISTAPTRADPALGFVGWGGPFARHLIGGGRKLAGPMTISGLPPGTIYVAACGFLADDMSGWGAAETTVTVGQTTKLYVPIQSTWAGHHEPPERLRPLVEKIKSFGREEFFALLFQRNGIKAPSYTGGGLQAKWQLDRVISRHLDRKVELPTGGTATFGDAMAALHYVWTDQLREKKK